LHQDNPSAAPYLVFLHATTRDDKHWPEENWRALIDLLADSGYVLSCRGRRMKKRGPNAWRRVTILSTSCRA
jgi:ADP-heptose:LPS heptosyltransferase